jgi:hypothetical protein
MVIVADNNTKHYGLINKVCCTSVLLDKSEKPALEIANSPSDAVITSRNLLLYSSLSALLAVIANAI